MGIEKQAVTNGTTFSWIPLDIDHLLGRFGLGNIKTIIVMMIWVFLIALSIYSVLLVTPGSWVASGAYSTTTQAFFLLYPPLIIGVLLVFWLGFEWGFIPLFLSTFVIAFSVGMPVQWGLLFATSFVLGLGIYALAYYCVPHDIHLRSIRSFAYFAIVSFLAAIASSLGSFVWSLFLGLSPEQTMFLWQGWWTGAFLQSIFIVAPLLMIFSPAIINLKNRHFQLPERKEVTLSWIYGAIATVVVILGLFIIGGQILGTQGLQSVMDAAPADMASKILVANESFSTIFWISLFLILTAGTGGIYLISSWNKTLMSEVNEKTAKLQLSEEQLKETLNHRELMLKEIHGKVRNNLSLILAMFDLQLKSMGDHALENALKNSHSRIRSISLIHETMAQSETLDSINLKAFALKLSNRLFQEHKKNNNNVNVQVNAEDVVVDLEKAVPICMIINELITHVYTHAFERYQQGTVHVDLHSDGILNFIVIRDDGRLLPLEFKWSDSKNYGARLVRALSKQMQGEFYVDDTHNSIAVIVPTDVREAV
jgi:two-component sensor histidine kinase